MCKLVRAAGPGPASHPPALRRDKSGARVFFDIKFGSGVLDLESGVWGRWLQAIPLRAGWPDRSRPVVPADVGIELATGKPALLGNGVWGKSDALAQVVAVQRAIRRLLGLVRLCQTLQFKK